MIQEIKQFDKIQIKTTRNINYLCAPEGMPSPHGIWSVIGNVGADLLVSKDGAICKVPGTDVILLGKSAADLLMEKINGEEDTE